jgi:hypothetical protein
MVGSADSRVDGVLDRLEGTLLTRVTSHSVSVPIASVVILDLQDPSPVPHDALVLVVGVDAPARLTEAIEWAARDGAVAVVVSEAVIGDRSADEVLRSAAMPVYALVAGASWTQLAALVMQGADAEDAPGDAALDLFDLADSLAGVLQAPLTIEDTTSRVLAFSRDQTETDDGRRQTILGMRVPDAYRELGPFGDAHSEILSSDFPVRVDRVPGARPRWAQRIAVGGEVLGSIWVIKDEALTDDQRSALLESARMVGLALVRARVAAATEQRARSSAVAELLAGGGRARRAASQLGYGSQPLLVVAIGALGTADDATMLTEAERRTRSLQTHLSAVAPRAVAALRGSVTFVVAPLRANADRASFTALVADFAARLRGGHPLRAGVGSVVTDPSDLAHSRDEAEAALRVLMDDPSDDRRIATLDEVWVGNVILSIGDALAIDRRKPMPGLLRLLEYDRDHQGALLLTLRAWLDAFGDVAKAAERVNVHKNTFRYRMSRIEEVGELSLDDPETRLAIQLQLRVFGL